MRCPREKELELYAINMVAGTFLKAKKTEKEEEIVAHLGKCPTCSDFVKTKAEQFRETKAKL